VVASEELFCFERVLTDERHITIFRILVGPPSFKQDLHLETTPIRR
jgi:hypothetical protein